jgi:hypothetical protein
MDLSTRSYNALHSYGIENIGQLCSKTLQELKNVDGIGKNAVIEITSCLRDKFGLSLSKPQRKLKVEKPKSGIPFEQIKTVATHLFSCINYTKDFAAELRISSMLIKKYGYEKLLYVPPNPKANHPAYFLSSFSERYFAEHLPKDDISGAETKTLKVVDKYADCRDFDKEEVETSELEEKILSEIQKPKTFKDFLK